MSTPKLPETLTLVLQPARVDQVLQALARLPWMEVADTITVIRQQADACIREFNEPKTGEAREVQGLAQAPVARKTAKR